MLKRLALQNLLFSLARFKESVTSRCADIDTDASLRYAGRFPTRITVVGFGMKRKRFEEVHREAIRWPSDAFDYVGIDDKGEVSYPLVSSTAANMHCRRGKAILARYIGLYLVWILSL